jgi:hypothetical protein
MSEKPLPGRMTRVSASAKPAKSLGILAGREAKPDDYEPDRYFVSGPIANSVGLRPFLPRIQFTKMNGSLPVGARKRFGRR